MKMKIMRTTFLWSLLMLIYRFSSFAQAYVPFPDSNATWLVGGYYYPPPPQCPGYCYSVYKTIIGDTIINTLSYKKVYNLGVDIYCVNNTGGLYYIGAFRQDIPNKQVLFVQSGASSELLLYNFNLNLNDTANGYYFGGILYVSEIDSVLIGFTYHRRLKLVHPNGGAIGDYLIEGLGPQNSGPFAAWPFFEQGEQLFCFNHNGNSFPISNCTLPTDTCGPLAINEINSKNSFSIYPNPTTGTLIIKKSSPFVKDCFIIIYNNMGKIILQKAIAAEKDLQLDLSKFGKGIYLVKVSENSNEFTQKIVVE